MRLTPVFMLSATSPAHFPPEARTFGAPEIAFLGRSNVGKSSLINALAGEEIAKTSSTPGRTRAINFFALHAGEGAKRKIRPTLILADLPGYGYAKISKAISAEWPQFIEPYLTGRETLALGICLVDTNIPPQASDTTLIRFFQQMGRPHLVVGTKADRIGQNALAKSLKALKEAHGVGEVLPVSAEKGKGIKELWTRVEALAVTSATRLPNENALSPVDLR